MKKVIITIYERYLDNIDKIAATLENEGLTITQQLECGIIIGFADEKTIEQISSKKEVESVVEDKVVSNLFISHNIKHYTICGFHTL